MYYFPYFVLNVTNHNQMQAAATYSCVRKLALSYAK